MKFESCSYGKWILAGEHSVLRGSEALVFPIFSRSMKLSYTQGEKLLEMSCSGESSDVLQPFLGALLNKALELVNHSADELTGKVIIENEISVGAGLGASAALCVNIAQWFVHLGWLKTDQIFNFSKELERIPHGESSGVDIATVMSRQGIAFRRDGEWLPLEVNWQPNWFLYHSGQQGITAKCVKQVNQFIEENPPLGKQVDADMRESVEWAKQALANQATEGIHLLKKSIELANSCFEKWRLIDPSMQKKQHWLIENGAIATKPVGSGGGGYLLGLWPNEKRPPDHILKDLISCNASHKERDPDE